VPSDSTASAAKHPASLSRGSSLLRLAGIGIVILCVVAGFLYLGGWFSPNAVTPARFVDAFERADGIFSGFRRNHAKGVGVSGYFESNGLGARLSKAVVFRPGRVPVLGRFSFGGGDPNVADSPTLVRGLGLQFWLPDGEEWRTAMVSLPVFPFKTPQDFYDNLVASQPDPKTGKPDPQHPLQWHLIITLGQPGDPTNDATVAWPDGREQVDVGTLTIDHVESEETSLARDINFDPLVLPSGMAMSDDPLLSARSAIYSQSFTRRAGEAKTPSAITPSDIRK
jgi:catalase